MITLQPSLLASIVFLAITIGMFVASTGRKQRISIALMGIAMIGFGVGDYFNNLIIPVGLVITGVMIILLALNKIDEAK